MERPAAPSAARYRLGDYQDYAPPAPLAHVAEGVWTHRIATEASLAEGAMHRVLPDPALSIAFRCRRDADGRPIDPELVAIGPKTRPHIFRFARGWETAAVRLKLEWVEPLFGLLPADHHDTERDLSGIYPFACALFDRLVETRTCTEAAATRAPSPGGRANPPRRARKRQPGRWSWFGAHPAACRWMASPGRPAARCATCGAPSGGKLGSRSSPTPG